jgi:glutathione-independent formaldehyde dehydrogenase
LVQSVRPTGRLGVVGVFPSEDPKSKDALEKKGQIAFDIGKFFEKGLTMGSGQTNVKQYNRRLANLIHEGKAKPSFLVSHVLPLGDAADAYKHFDNREKGWTKVILKPAAKKAIEITKHKVAAATRAS